jgi:Protein of unknown function (DUF1566)
MKHKLSTTIGLIVLLTIALAASLAEAQTTAAGPYYANPSWDQTLACTTSANCPRFIVLSNMSSNAVLDRETGLVWEKSPSADEVVWSEAQFHCNPLNLGNRLGWRLPVLQELASLVDPSVPFPGPTLPSGHPFNNVQPHSYWSATTDANNTGNAWLVGFGSALMERLDKVHQARFAWCVRGGQGIDPQ